MKTSKMLMMLFVLFVSLVSCGQKQGAQPEAVADPQGFIVQVGDTAPDFTAKTITGDIIKLSDLRGKVVMLQFTASWCRVCREEMPHIESEIWQQHKENPKFVLIGIDRDEPIEKVVHFVETIGTTYPMALDPGSEIFKKYALEEAGVTRNVLIDENGKIIYTTRLYDPAEFADFVKFIDTQVN